MLHRDLNDFAQETDRHYDVVIVGAGMVGLSLAAGLRHAGLRLLLIEAFPLTLSSSPCSRSFDERSTALSWSSVQILQTLAVWQGCAADACEIKQVHVSEKGRWGTTRLEGDTSLAPALGYVVPNQMLGAALSGVLEGAYSSEITLLSPARVTHATIDDDGAQLSLGLAGSSAGGLAGSLAEGPADSATKQSPLISCSAELLVIADGAGSRTAQLLGIGQAQKDYSQQAIVCNIATSAPNMGVAYERFTPEGPLAMLPLQAQLSALVWTMPPALAEQRMALSDADFLAALQARFSDRLGRLTACSERHTYPLVLRQATEQVRRHCLVLGNAAQSLHPVAGQGFNLALRGVAHTISAITEAQTQDHRLGDLAGLRGITAAHQADRQRTIAMSDRLVNTFGDASFLMTHLREGGLIALNNLPPLKRWFTKQAMGMGQTSPLAQGAALQPGVTQSLEEPAGP